MVLEFADGYLDGLTEITSIYEASKSALPQVIVAAQKLKESFWAPGDELFELEVK